MTEKTILLVEDNPKVMRNNSNLLKARGAKVLTAATMAEARRIVNTTQTAAQNIDIAVIDIMLQDGSGLGLLKEIRSFRGSAALPVLLLTAKGESHDIVQGLSAGADDYLAKPYDLNVFAARIEALLRRTVMQRAPAKISNNITIGSFCFDIIANQAFYNGKGLPLSKKEYALLFLLAQNKGKTLSAQYLYENVWKRHYKDTAVLKVHVSNLKKKLAAAAADILIESSWGEGYCLYNP